MGEILIDEETERERERERERSNERSGDREGRDYFFQEFKSMHKLPSSNVCIRIVIASTIKCSYNDKNKNPDSNNKTSTILTITFNS